MRRISHAETVAAVERRLAGNGRGAFDCIAWRGDRFVVRLIVKQAN